MSTLNSVVKNTAFLFSREIVNKIISFILIILITRHLGDVVFGKFSFSFAFIGLFIVFSHIGLNVFAVKEISRDKSKAKQIINNILTIKLALLIVLYLIIFLLSIILPQTKELFFLLFLVLSHEVFVVLSLVFQALFKAYEKNHLSLYSMMVDRISALIFVLITILLKLGINYIILALIISKAISFLYHFYLCQKNFFSVSFSFDFKYWKELIKNSIPFWVTRIFLEIYYRIDKVMLTALKSYSMTGWYTAASNLVSALTFIPSVIIGSTFPVMSKFHHANSKKKVEITFHKAFKYLLIISVPLTIGISLLSQRIILFIYDKQFLQSEKVLTILSFSLIFIFSNQIMGYLLNSINKQLLFSLSAGICAITNVTFNFILIPPLGHIGAAIATIASQFLNSCFLFYFTSKNGFKISIIKVSYKPIIAGLLMGFIIINISFITILYIIPISIIIYFLALYIMGGINKEEINLIKSIFKKKN